MDNPHELPGWYKRPACSPGSPADIDAQRAAGLRAVVLRLRFQGIYLPMRLLSDRPRAAGLVLSHDEYGASALVELIAADPSVRPPIPPLLGARVLKRRLDGSMLLEGQEWDEAHIHRWPQTWLVCETAMAIDAALVPMQDWLHKQYESARAQFQARG